MEDCGADVGSDDSRSGIWTEVRGAGGWMEVCGADVGSDDFRSDIWTEDRGPTGWMEDCGDSMRDWRADVATDAGGAKLGTAGVGAAIRAEGSELTRKPETCTWDRE